MQCMSHNSITVVIWHLIRTARIFFNPSRFALRIPEFTEIMEELQNHRENNIILAKNLNQAKVDLREKKRNIESLKAVLYADREKLIEKNYNELQMLEKIEMFKKQLDQTFINNTMGYMRLSMQIDEIREQAIKNSGASKLLVGPSGVSYHARMTINSDALMAKAALNDITNYSNDSSMTSMDLSAISHNSTFSFASNENESTMNTTFICSDDENVDRRANVTIRRKKKSYMRETKSTSIKKVERKSIGGQPNRSSSELSKSMISSRGRVVKKIDYCEFSAGEQYKRLCKISK